MKNIVSLLLFFSFYFPIQIVAAVPPSTQYIDSLNNLSYDLRKKDKEHSLVLARMAHNASVNLDYNEGQAYAEYNMGNYYRGKNDNDNAIRSYNRALLKISPEQNRELIVKLLNVKGLALKHELLFDSALTSFYSSMEYWNPKFCDEEYLMKIQYNIGNTYKGMGLYDSSLHYSFKGLRIAEKLNRPNKVLASYYYTIGNTYHKNEDPTNALTYLLKSKELYEDHEDGVARALTSIGNVYDLKEEHEKALEFYYKSLRIEQKRPFEDQFSGIYNNISQQYIYLEQLDSVQHYAKIALELSQMIRDDEGIAISMTQLGHVKIENEQIDEGLSLYNQALETANTYDLISLQDEIVLKLATIYKKTGYPDSSIKYMEIHDTIRERLMNEDNQRNILVIEKKYQTEKKNKRIKELELNNIIEKQNKLYWVYGAIGVFVVFTLLMFLQVYRHRNKSLLIAKASLIEGEEIERARLSKELHDNVGATLSMASMIIQTAFKENSNSDKTLEAKAKNLLDQSLTHIRTLSHELSPSILTKFGLQTAFELLLEGLTEAGIQTILKYELKPENKYPSTFELALYRVLQELINNIVKHANATDVVITIKEGSKDQIVLIAKDNGKGFNPKSKEGIGMHNIRSRIETYKGKLTVQSDPEQGTEVMITVVIPA